MNHTDESRDRGNILPLILVMVVIMGLVLVPTLRYASTVLRANAVVADGAKDMEAVRAGARVALGDPFEVFQKCKPGSTYTTSSNINGSSYTVCNQIGETGLIPAAERHRGAVAIQLNETYPNNAIDGEAPLPSDLTDWWVSNSTAQPEVGKIWTPALPAKPSVTSDPEGYYLGDPYYCTVYFPGTFDQPVVIDEQTYFASGVYYFEENVTVVGGADATVGMGLHEGCTDDYDVASLIEPIEPLPNGGGGTFVFGDDAQLIIDDSLATDVGGNIVANTSNEALRFQFNQRYVQEAWQPEARVSVMSVNGHLEGTPGPPATPGPLVVTDVIDMPLSDVATSTSLVPATDQGYLPSTLTAEPRLPEPPTGFAVLPLRDPSAPPGQRAVFGMEWDVPDAQAEGGSTITEYVVTAQPGNHLCVTDGATYCVLTGLDRNVWYDFTVTAENAVGVSDPSISITESAQGGSVLIADEPEEPINVTFDPYDDAAEIHWDAPLDDGGVPIVAYEVTAWRAYKFLPTDLVEQREDQPQTCTTTVHRNNPAPQRCSIPLSDLPPLDGMGYTNVSWRFEVKARNAIGLSDPSDPTTYDTLILDGTAAPGPDPIVIPVAATYIPDPIIDINTSSAASAEIEFAGYISVPQGRVAVEKSSDIVLLRGGVMAGSWDVANDVATEPGTTIGFENTTLQRVLQIVTTAGRATSTMTVQINENGEYAVNSWVIQ